MVFSVSARQRPGKISDRPFLHRHQGLPIFKRLLLASRSAGFSLKYFTVFSFTSVIPTASEYNCQLRITFISRARLLFPSDGHPISYQLARWVSTDKRAYRTPGVLGRDSSGNATYRPRGAKGSRNTEQPTCLLCVF